MKNLIRNYAKNMTKQDLINFIKNKNYTVSQKEIDIIYNHIKTYTDEILQNPIKYINLLKGKISNTNYEEMLNLFNRYKNYLK